MKRVSIIFVFIFYYSFNTFTNTNVSAQEGILWKFKTYGRISTSPIVRGDKIYCGSDDSYLYCRNAKTGEAIWSYKADTSILSNPVLSGDIIFFESANILYAINATSGEELWKFNPSIDTLVYKIDPWDYHHSSPIVDDTVVYYGCGDGTLLGVKIATGDAILEYHTVNHSAIRSTPFLRDGVLYFGDWHSRIYALDIAAEDTLWTLETVVPIPYETFGAVVTQLIEYKNALYFGSRNNTVRSVDIATGQDKWSIFDPSGSWMAGYPVIYDSTLYIGGSDNHQLWAINAHTGAIIWKYTAGQNIFTKPLISDNYIIISSGTGGTMDIPNPFSKGYIHLINKSTGLLINKFMVNGNIFSSPVLVDGILYFGSNDSTLYAVDSGYLFRPVPVLDFEFPGPINLGKISKDTLTNITILNTGDIADTLDISISSSIDPPQGLYELSDSSLIIAPGLSGSLIITIHTQDMITGNYNFYVNFFSREMNWFSLSKKINFRVTTITSNVATKEQSIILFPNPANDFLNFSSSDQLIGIEIYNVCGILVLKESVANYHHQQDISSLKKGIYLIKLISLSGDECRQIIIQ